jgi:rhodanese-related sulfurtransferase
MAADHSPRFLDLVDRIRRQVVEISIPDFEAELRARRTALAAGQPLAPLYFFDVREDHEWHAGHIPGAEHLGKGILERDIEKRVPDPHAEIVLYCGGGFRSALAAYAVGQMGYTRVRSLAGGFRGWRDSGRPLVVPADAPSGTGPSPPTSGGAAAP